MRPATSDSPQVNLTLLKRNHALLGPAQLSDMAEEAAHDLMSECESGNMRASYRTAMRYWAAWFNARYDHQMDLPVVIQAIVDNAERSTKAGLVHQLPPEIDATLVEAGFNSKKGAPALKTMMHQASVLSMAHHLAKQPNPCACAAAARASTHPSAETRPRESVLAASDSARLRRIPHV